MHIPEMKESSNINNNDVTQSTMIQKNNRRHQSQPRFIDQYIEPPQLQISRDETDKDNFQASDNRKINAEIETRNTF